MFGQDVDDRESPSCSPNSLWIHIYEASPFESYRFLLDYFESHDCFGPYYIVILFSGALDVYSLPYWSNSFARLTMSKPVVFWPAAWAQSVSSNEASRDTDFDGKSIRDPRQLSSGSILDHLLSQKSP